MANQRGRQSAATQIGPVAASIERPAPPDDLTADQAAEWMAVVGRLKPDWFGRETHALLAQYCRHVVAARKVARMLAELPESCVDDYDKLLKMQEREGRAMSSLATRLRLTPQSTYDPKKTKGAGTGRDKPWQKV